ncbi:ABC transporter substrate-binding protein, partial [Pseudomonas syringae pv. theae]|nr:ABC transporter substrate-binding protein [Pseudomonas syringae pv. theae]
QTLIDKARETVNPQDRAALYEQAQAIFNKDQPWISMAHTRMFTAMRNNVEGYQISPLTTSNFATTRVK